MSYIHIPSLKFLESDIGGATVMMMGMLGSGISFTNIYVALVINIFLNGFESLVTLIELTLNGMTWVPYRKIWLL